MQIPSIELLNDQANGFKAQAEAISEVTKALDDLVEKIKLTHQEPAPERYKEKYLEIRQGLERAEEMASIMAQNYNRIVKEYQRVEGPAGGRDKRRRMA